MSRLVAVGRVTGPHGVRGWVKVELLTGDPGRFTQLGEVLAGLPGGEPAAYKVEETGSQPKNALLKLGGVSDRDQAEALKGATLFIPESLVPPPSGGEYYYYQLEGLRVETETGEHAGTLDFVGNTPGNDVYFVLPPGGGEHRLVPALKKAIVSIDLEKGLMVVRKDWIV